MLSINLVAVLVAAIANFVIGFLLHGPVAGKLWMKLANIHPTGKEKLSDMIPQMVKNFIANLVFAYVLEMFIFVTTSYYNTVGSVLSGIGIAFWVWFGFIVTGSSMEVIWMGKKLKLWLFEIFSSLLSILAMGAILAAW